MKKIIWLVVIIAILVGIYFYAFRPVSAPSESINAASTPLSTTTASSTVYHISQTGSTVSFKISEVLSGAPFTPVGTTNQIAGDIAVAPTASGVPSLTIGTLTIDARTFHTDSSERDGAIGRFILKSNVAANEFITFAPSSTSVPIENSDGTWSATSTGDLMISGVTKPETFVLDFSIANGTLTGTARTTLSRSDFNLVIPNIPFVADVSNTFSISASITAAPVIHFDSLTAFC